jgi:hypothetical protein
MTRKVESLLRCTSTFIVLATVPATMRGVETVFTALPPCRLVDTRLSPGPLQPGVVQSYVFRGSCGIPPLTGDGGREANVATALALNIVAVAATGGGHLTVWPANQPRPLASSINYSSIAETGGLNIANGIIAPMCDQVSDTPCSGGDISFRAASNPVHLVVDVVGYFSHARLPGQERWGAGAGRDNFLCIRNGQRSGLSTLPVTWLEAQSSCPAGTRVCLESEVPATGCDTTRPDGICDWINCSGACQDALPDQHWGWTRNLVDSWIGQAVQEGGGRGPFINCSRLPVWCCSVD